MDFQSRSSGEDTVEPRMKNTFRELPKPEKQQMNHIATPRKRCEATHTSTKQPPLHVAIAVRHHHEQNAHQLVDATIAAVRNRYTGYRVCAPSSSRLGLPAIPAPQKESETGHPISQGQLPRDRLTAYVYVPSRTPAWIISVQSYSHDWPKK